MPPTYYDPNDRPPEFLVGIFPGHIVDVKSWDRGFTKNKDGEMSKPFNFTLRFDIASSKAVGLSKAGEQMSGENLIGQLIRSVGIWYTKNPSRENRWKNNRYHDTCIACGLKLKKSKVKEKDKDGNEIEKELFELPDLDDHAYDLLGKPVLFRTDIETSKDGKKYIKAYDIMPWEKGKPISKEEAQASIKPKAGSADSVDDDDDDLPF